MCTECVYFSEHSLGSMYILCASEVRDQARGSMCQLAWRLGVLEWETCEGVRACVCACVCVCVWSAGDM